MRQGLKPIPNSGVDGTAEAVPYKAQSGYNPALANPEEAVLIKIKLAHRCVRAALTVPEGVC